MVFSLYKRRMRIVSGKYRRRQLKEVSSEATRSTKDRVKESLFNILGTTVQHACVCDAFAGSGALALEAISRGAVHAVCIEKNNEAFSVLKDNIDSLDASSQLTILKGDALRLLKTLDTRFDIVFLDPPYESDLLGESLEVLKQKKLLQTGCIVVSLSRKNSEITVPEGFSLVKQRNVGITTLTFYEWSDNDENRTISREL